MTRALTVVLWLALAPSALGAASFTRTDISLAESGKPSTPLAMETAYVDGDNDPDVLVNLFASGAASDLGVLINDGSGGFEPLKRFPLCNEAADLVVADFNDDGKQDVVVACYGPLNVLFGDGTGGFGAPQPFSTGPNDLTNRREVEAIQVNPGGPPELGFVREAGGGNAVICFTATTEPADSFPNCGNPSPMYPQPPPIARYPLRAVTFPDVDGVLRRGSLLVPSAATNTKVALFTRDWATNYQTWYSVDYAAGGDKITIADGADVENDGDLDFVIGRGDGFFGELSIGLNNNGIPQDAPPPTVPTILAPEDVGVADVDLDGKRDVVFSGPYGKLAVHAGAGDGSFGALQEVPLIGFGDPSYASSTRMAIADVTCDGKADVLVTDYFAQALEVLANTGPGAGTGDCIPPPPPPPDPGPGPTAPPPVQLPPVYAPSGGVAARGSSSLAGLKKSFAVGTVTNPPTASTTQTLSRDGTVLARGTTTVPADQSKPLKLRLNKAGRKRMRKVKKKLKLKLKVVATAPDGTKGTVERKVTLRRS